jgi:hypothetical protein
MARMFGVWGRRSVDFCQSATEAGAGTLLELAERTVADTPASRLRAFLPPRA